MGPTRSLVAVPAVGAMVAMAISPAPAQTVRGTLVDGMQALSELNDIVRADELDKIEFYASAQGVPAGYRTSAYGTLLIWTPRFTEK